MKAKHLQLALLIGLLAYAPFSHAMIWGQAPTSGVWDGIKTFINTQLLQSNYAIMLTFLAMCGGLWKLTHGGGFGFLGVVLGIVIIAGIGPTFVDAAATATASPSYLKSQHVVSPWASHQLAKSNQPLTGKA